MHEEIGKISYNKFSTLTIYYYSSVEVGAVEIIEKKRYDKE